jgi:tetratricopeptide (TPR) repeat protein
VRTASLLLAVACSLPVAHASETAIETRKVQPVTVERLLETPQSFQSALVRFRGTWIGVTDVFDQQRSHFHPERYVNFAVWPDRAALWQPEVRAKPLATLYLGKDRPGAHRPAEIKRYQAVEIEGRIAAIMDGQPWIEVTSVRPIEGVGAFTASAITQVEQGIAFAAAGARDLADEHFAKALAGDLPASGRIGVGELRARSLMEAGAWERATEVLAAIVPMADADGAMPTATRAQLHAALARCLAETAGSDQAKHAAAAAEAEQAIALDPTLSEAYAVLGTSLAGLGRLDEAAIQSDRAVRMRPDDAAVRLAYGRILDRQGRYDEAIDALRRAIDLTPKDPAVHLAFAQAHLGRGKAGNPKDLPIALRECEITLRLDAKRADAHWLAGQVLEAATAASLELPLQRGAAVPTREDATARYQAALAIDPNNAGAKAALQAFADADAAAAAAKAAAEAAAAAEAKAKADAEAAAAAKAKADADAAAAAKAAADAAKANPEAKPEVKPEAKPEVKPEAKPAPKPEAKPEAKPAPKAEVKPEAKPAPKKTAEQEAIESAMAAAMAAEAQAKAEAEAKAKAEAEAAARQAKP